MTNAKPEKKDKKHIELGYGPLYAEMNAGINGYNQSHAEWTAYVDELLKPLEKVLEYYRWRDPDAQMATSLWHKISEVLRAHNWDKENGK